MLNKIVIAIVILSILAVAGIVVGVYFVLKNSSSPATVPSPTNTTTQPTTIPTVVTDPLSVLSVPGFTLVPNFDPLVVDYSVTIPWFGKPGIFAQAQNDHPMTLNSSSLSPNTETILFTSEYTLIVNDTTTYNISIYRDVLVQDSNILKPLGIEQQFFARRKSQVAISENNDIVVGAELSTLSGSVYFFSPPYSTPQIVTLSAVDVVNFGYSVAISGNVAVIGAPKDNIAEGKVYVFEKDTLGIWSEQSILTTPFTQYEFGSTVAIGGSIIVVISQAQLSDRIDIFAKLAGIWVEQLSAYVSSLGFETDHQRYSIAICEATETIIVGGTGLNQLGRVIGLTRTDTLWTAAHTFIDPDQEIEDEFGHSVSISPTGNTVAVGAWEKNNFTGSVMIYNRIGNGYVLVDIMTGEYPSSRFGSSVSIYDNMLIVGSSGGQANPQLNPLEGSVQTFVKYENWKQIQRLVCVPTGVDGSFGATVGLSIDGVIVASQPGGNKVPGEAFGLGEAFVF